jgi:tetratricopeptide (TPR) repeat protein
MRKFNAKLFLVLLVVAAAGAGAVFGAHCYQYPRIAEALLWQAARAEEQGQLERAARYLQRYLEFAPRDDAERAHLARIWAGDAFAGLPKARARALGLLDQVLTRDPGQAELRRLLVRVALEIGRVKAARDNLQVLLPEKDATWPAGPEPAPDAARGELEALWGQLYEAETKPARAITLYAQAVHDAPRQQVSYARLAALLRRQPETDPQRRAANDARADELMDRLVKNNPESYESYLARWRYRREFGLLKDQGVLHAGRLREYSEDVAQALKRVPKDREVEVLLAASDVERLWADQVEALPVDSDDPEAALKERKAEARKHRDEARKYLEQGLRVETEAPPAGAGAAKPEARRLTEAARYQLLWYLGTLWLDEADPGDPSPDGGARAAAEAEKVIARLRKTKAPPASADYLQARLLMARRQWAEAAALLEQARPVLQSQGELAAQVDLFLGLCYKQLEEPGQALAAYARALEWDRQSVPALVGMADALWAQGRHDDAMTNYRQAMAQARVPPGGWLGLAALEIERQLQKERPERSWDEALRHLDRAEKGQKARSAEAAVLRAEILMGQGKLEEAKDALEKARDQQPDKVELWVALADLDTFRNKGYGVLRLLDEAERDPKLAGRVELRLARAHYWSTRKGDPEAAAALARLTDGMDKLGADDQARLLSGLAEAQYQAGNPAAARALLAEMARRPQFHNDLRVRLLLFDLAAKAGDEAGMRQALDEIRAAERSQGAFGLFGEALALVWRARERKEAGKLGDARFLLDRVDRIRPGWSRVLLARAEVEELAGNPEEAINLLKRAIEQGERGQETVQRLVVLLYQRGRYVEAKEELLRLQRGPAQSPQMRLVQAGLEMHTGGSPLKDLEALTRDVSEEARDPRYLAALAEILGAAGQADKAEAKLTEATERAPKDPEAWVARVRFLASRNRSAEAEAIIKEAAGRLAPEQVPLMAAQGYEALGMADTAAARYEEALARRPDDITTVRSAARFYLQARRLGPATALLERIVKGEVRSATDRDVAWARHGLAVVLAASTDFRSFQKALGLVELKLDEHGALVGAPDAAGRAGSADGQLAQARVLATQPQRQFRQKAIQLFEAVQRAGRLEANDRFILALLYDADGVWPKANELFRGLVASNGQVPDYLAQYALRLLRAGQRDEAAGLVDRLEALEKARDLPAGALGSVELRARVLENSGKGDEALELLRNYVKRRGARPEEMLFLIASLGRQKRFAEAFELCPEAWQKCPPEAAGGVTVALLRAMTPTDEQTRRAEGWLQSAIGKHAENMALRMHLADLYDMRGRYEQSEELYRLVLKKEPGNVIALNNLAWLLARRADNGDDPRHAAEALPLIDAAVQGVGRRADLLDTRGLVRLAQGQTDEALSDLREATADVPTPARLFHLACAHHRAKDREGAARALREAKKLGLQVATLHPLEQKRCRQLLEELGVQ